MSASLRKGLYIVGAKRTPFGTFGGKLKNFSATDVAEHASRAAIQAASVPAEAVDSVIFGNVIQSSKDAAYLARHVGLRVGLPVPVPALTLNRLCGSGFQVPHSIGGSSKSKRGRRGKSGREDVLSEEGEEEWEGGKEAEGWESKGGAKKKTTRTQGTQASDIGLDDLLTSPAASTPGAPSPTGASSAHDGRRTESLTDKPCPF